jgi:hypothetical protein
VLILGWVLPLLLVANAKLCVVRTHEAETLNLALSQGFIICIYFLHAKYQFKALADFIE